MELLNFKLNVKQKEKLYNRYIRLTEKARDIDISISKKDLEKLALEVYVE